MILCVKKTLNFESVKETVSNGKTYYKLCVRDKDNGEYIQLDVTSNCVEYLKALSANTGINCDIKCTSFYNEATKIFGYRLCAYNIE